MSKGKPPRKKPAPPPPPPRPAPSQDGALDAGGRWWLTCYELLAKHLERAPSINELARYTKLTTTPVHRQLSKLEAQGYFVRDERRHFVRTGRQP